MSDCPNCAKLKAERDSLAEELRTSESAAELGRRFLAYYRRHVADTTALPCQLEDAGKGSYVYNWRRAFERDMENSMGEALTALAPSAPAAENGRDA